jgi:hypothetical protein
MGLPIGELPGGLTSAPEPLPIEAVRGIGEETRARNFVRRNPRAADNPLFDRDVEEVVADRAGFGEGTLSPPGAALATVRRGVEEARDLVPSIEEERAEVQQRIAEMRERLQGNDGERPAPVPLDLSVGRAEAAGAAREFIRIVNEGAGQAAARLSGEAPPQAPGPSIQFEGETIPLRQPNPQGIPQPQVIDILA